MKKQKKRPTLPERPPDKRMAVDSKKPFVVRVWGFHYEKGGNFREVWAVGWMTENGGCSSDRGQAARYASHDEAWYHAILTNNVGEDEQRGAWCWVEDEREVDHDWPERRMPREDFNDTCATCGCERRAPRWDEIWVGPSDPTTYRLKGAEGWTFIQPPCEVKS